jgi:hypothetical protein
MELTGQSDFEVSQSSALPVKQVGGSSGREGIFSKQ